MLLLDPDHLLLSVGDQGYNGVDFPDQPDWVQNPSASYGKTVRISLADGSWQPYTIGHRNPQGLLSDGQGRIWLTEHGPQGGDELNLLTAGSNYGWPKVTYGTDYGKQAWPLNPRQGRHEGFVEPVYSWAKSIGPSNLIEIRGNLFTSWAGDLLIGTLIGESLMRIRLDQGHVRLIEPIPVGERVRDLIEDSSGRIVLLTDSYSLVILEPAQSGFAMCAGCHALTGKPGSGLGPDLSGVLGSAIAARPGFAYSEALKKVGGVWTEAELDRFLTDPQAFAPGSSMTMAGIPDADIRRRVIEFLKTP